MARRDPTQPNSDRATHTPNIYPNAAYYVQLFPYLLQIFLIILVVIAALVNLTLGYPHQELWISLLSSCLGYTLPNPKLKLITTPASSDANNNSILHRQSSNNLISSPVAPSNTRL